MKTLYRDRWDKKIGGVCGGIGQFLRIDPTVIRMVMTFVCIITGIFPLMVGYVIIWILLPLGPHTYVDYKCRRLYRRPKQGKIAGICVGIGHFFKIDPILVRVITVAILILTGLIPTLITYIVGIVVIPQTFPKRR